MKVIHFSTESRSVYVELTRRNLEVLLAKLDDETSARTIIKSDKAGMITVRAVENEAHYSDREPGPMKVGGEII
jgi:hypothetical protein